MTTIASLTHVTDTELLAAVTRAAAQERSATTQLIALLAELDTRRLYLGEGYSSLFTYCTQMLHLSEHAALQSVVKVWRGTETGEAPRWQGATTENT